MLLNFLMKVLCKNFFLSCNLYNVHAGKYLGNIKHKECTLFMISYNVAGCSELSLYKNVLLLPNFDSKSLVDLCSPVSPGEWKSLER